jgi:hypothetical protein
MNPVQNNAFFHTTRKSIPDVAFATRAFNQITDFKIESVFIIFFSWYIIHELKKVMVSAVNIGGNCYHKISWITRNIKHLKG